MRYQGQIRFPDVDTGDLDVSVEVDDTHVRILAGGKSLGRWCLADVVADRLLANEFELDLDGEVVRFLAEDQINFAYGAVQAMAEGWARYKAMNFVKRGRAIASARKGNEPSRLREAHEAFVMAREALGEEEANVVEEETSDGRPSSQSPAPEVPARPSPPERVVESEVPEEAVPEDKRGERRRHLATPETQQPGSDLTRTSAEPTQTEHAEPPPMAEPASAAHTPVEEAEAVSWPVAPAEDDSDQDSGSTPPQPSLSERLAQARAAAESAAESAAEAAEEPASERRLSEPAVLPRKVPRIDTFPGRGAAETDRAPDTPQTGSGDPIPAETPPAAEVDAGPASTPASAPAGAEPEPESRSGATAGPDIRRKVEVEGSPEPRPAPPPPKVESPRLEPESRLAEPEPAGSTAGSAADADARPEDSAGAVGAYADGHHPAETSGLRASLRSVFSRSKAEPHEHSYIESTTAVGLTRRVCIECGHVSIGVSTE